MLIDVPHSQSAQLGGITPMLAFITSVATGVLVALIVDFIKDRFDKK
jgi:hypothetical protein